MAPRSFLVAGLLACLLWIGLGFARAEAAPSEADPHQILVMLRLPPTHFNSGGSYDGSYNNMSGKIARRKIAERIAKDQGFTLVDSWPMPLLGVDCFVLKVPAKVELDAAVASVSRDKMVVWAEPLQTFRTQGAPPVPKGSMPKASTRGDPLFALQPGAMHWRLADLHQIATGRGVTIAIVDSKIDMVHPDLAGGFAASQDFVVGHPAGAEQHGTGVAGVIGARAENGLGIAGIAPDARLLALRACWQQPGDQSGTAYCDSLSLAKAVHFAIERGAQIINLSLSGPPNILLERLITLAMSRKITVVAAYDPKLPSGGFPASLQGVIAVGDESLRSVRRSVYNAPGQDVPTTQPGGKWYFVNGSSYSAAHVSGLLALMRQARRADPALLVTNPAASGAIDACASLVPTSPACECSCALARTALVQHR